MWIINKVTSDSIHFNSSNFQQYSVTDILCYEKVFDLFSVKWAIMKLKSIVKLNIKPAKKVLDVACGAAFHFYLTPLKMIRWYCQKKKTKKKKQTKEMKKLKCDKEGLIHRNPTRERKDLDNCWFSPTVNILRKTFPHSHNLFRVPTLSYLMRCSST